MAKASKAKHPMQPIIKDTVGVIRFKKNAIVQILLDTGNLNLNDLASMPFSDEDRMQLVQLIGYSISGYAELPYVSRASIREADKKAASL